MTKPNVVALGAPNVPQEKRDELLAVLDRVREDVIAGNVSGFAMCPMAADGRSFQTVIYSGEMSRAMTLGLLYQLLHDAASSP